MGGVADGKYECLKCKQGYDKEGLFWFDKNISEYICNSCADEIIEAYILIIR